MSALALASQLSKVSTKLTMYCLTPIYVIGILGNVFDVIIFSHRTLRGNACSRYFVGMSFAQMIALNTFEVTRIITYIVGYDTAQTMVVLCKMRIDFYVFSLGVVRQFLRLISMDRWIVSTRNTCIRKLSSSSIIRWLIVDSMAFWILFSIHGLIGHQA